MIDPLTVLVLTPSIGGHYFGELLTGLTREIAGAGGRLVLVQTLEPGTHSDEVGAPGAFAMPVAWAQVSGVISITSAVRGSYLQRLRDLGIPVVLTSTRLTDFEAPLATPDNDRGTRAAVEHLIEHGHTQIGFVGNLAQHDVRARYDAYRATLASHELRDDPTLLFAAPDNAQTGGVRAARELLAATARPTAVMVATDRNAIGLMRTLADAGIRVPEDVAVVGFDNTEAAAFSAPTLSSVDQRFDEIGALAGRLVLDQIRGAVVPFVAHTPRTIALAVRESCGCAVDALTTELAPAPGMPVAAPIRVLAELERALFDALGTDPVVSTTLSRDAALEAVRGLGRDLVRDAARETGRLVDAGDDVTAAQIRALTAALRRLTPRPDILRLITRAVTEFVQRNSGGRSGPRGDSPGAAGHARLAAALWQLQAGAFLRQSESGENAIEEQYVVDAGLLDAGRSNPRHLGWLAGTHVRAGALALWDDDDASSGRLQIVGAYDPGGLLPGLVGSVTTAEQFPPAQLVGAGRPSEHSVCIVVPVHTREHEWGLLAVVGEIDTTSARETYYHWAALLCEALESEHLQTAVRVSEERYALAARATNDGLWEWDGSSSDIYVSDRCSGIVGFAPGHSWTKAEWQSRVHPDDRPTLAERLHKVLDGDQETVECEYRFRFADGTYRWVLLRTIGVRPVGGPVVRLVGSLADIDTRHSLEDQLRENALHDPLTSLPNRRLFLDRLEQAIALRQRSGTPFAVVFLDLDGFKQVNDSLGHPMGDRLLCEVGARIAAELRSVDTGSRFGGDEFAILLHDVRSADALVFAGRLQASLAAALDLDGHEIVIRASLGIATSAIGATSPEEILRDADAAMYYAKTTERGSVAFFDAAMHARAAHQLRRQTEVRRALESQQFEVHYQPVVDLRTGRTERFEALVRWRHPSRGLLLPGEFLPLMADMGLIIGMGRWILDEVCARLAGWGAGVTNVAVNLSDREFWHAELLTEVRNCLKRHDLGADRLTLEISEAVIVGHPDAALRLMRDLHDAGLRLCVDNFGTGYASLETLHRLPLDEFKIDRSWIRGVGAPAGVRGADGNSSADNDGGVDGGVGGGVGVGGDGGGGLLRTEGLVRAAVAMGAALGLVVVAQGIETLAQRAFLREAGCTTGQGFWFGAAVPADQVLGLVDRDPRTVGGMGIPRS